MLYFFNTAFLVILSIEKIKDYKKLAVKFIIPKYGNMVFKIYKPGGRFCVPSASGKKFQRRKTHDPGLCKMRRNIYRVFCISCFFVPDVQE
jgi:hypothetical protein